MFLYLLLIGIICFGDHKFTPNDSDTNAITRYLVHITALVLIGLTGMLAWNKKDYPWQHSLWLWGYAIIVGFIAVSGVINYFMPFSKPVKEAITVVRVGFANPLPFIVLCVLTAMAAKSR